MNLNLGALETNWKFLVVDNLNEPELGEDFIVYKIVYKILYKIMGNYR